MYRRGGASHTPLFVSLPAVKDPGKGAVEETLAGVGLSSLAKEEWTSVAAGHGGPLIDGSGRHWVVILDGYDEVLGATNFVVGNKLDRAGARVKVSEWTGLALEVGRGW